MNKHRVISPEYLVEQIALHENPNYGRASSHYAHLVGNILIDLQIDSVSDYGAGKMNLLLALRNLGRPPRKYYPYDPAFPEYGKPVPGDLVTCIDVLEHVEPDCIDTVLSELAGITIKYGFFTIHTGPARKVLSDGRNAHLIQKPTSWWLPRLCEHFEVVKLESMDNGFWLIVRSHNKQDFASSGRNNPDLVNTETHSNQVITF